MNRQPRDLTPALSAYYAKRHPTRPPKDMFSDELLALADMQFAQMEMIWSKISSDPLPVIYPPAIAEGALVQPSVRPSGRKPGRPE